jgi:hypothetical protein
VSQPHRSWPAKGEPATEAPAPISWEEFDRCRITFWRQEIATWPHRVVRLDLQETNLSSQPASIHPPAYGGGHDHRHQEQVARMVNLKGAFVAVA